MLDENFNQGAFIVSRSLFESHIWYMSPEYLKIWIYILGKANHKGRKYNGYYCERGQYFCSYKELTEQISYKIGYRKSGQHDVTTKRVMMFLRKHLMINTTKKPRGVLIEVLNYTKYQELSNYEKTNEKTNERTIGEPATNQSGLSINKNDKNDKNENNSYAVQPETKSLYNSIEEMCGRYGIQNKVNPKSLDPIVGRYLGKIKMKVEMQHCIAWLIDREMKMISTQRLGNWFKKAQEIQKREELKQQTDYISKEKQ